MAGYQVRVVPGSELGRLRRVPPVVVVRGRRPGRLLAHAAFLAVLDRKLGASGASTVVLEFDESSRRFVDEAARVVRAIGRAAQVELAYGPDGGRSAMTEVQVKALARQGAQTDDALALAREVVRSSATLRATSGRLSAKAIAEAFGLSVAELASVLGTSRQRLSKTPDAKALQSALSPFERVFRLRSVVPQEEFAAWLRQANLQLDEATPLECIQVGEVDVVADLVEGMLTGRPT
jgi:hypothetical protein